MIPDLGQVIRLYIEPGLSILPPRMTSPDAVRMLLAIGLQESRFIHRRQIGGPARSWWQFELTGVEGVREHRASKDHLLAAQITLGYRYANGHALYMACEHNDALGCVLARLLLWRLPEQLPMAHEVEEGWRQYNDRTWRPGKPKPETWPTMWAHACEAVAAYYLPEE